MKGPLTMFVGLLVLFVALATPNESTAKDSSAILKAYSEICELRNASQTYATAPPAEKREKVSMLYNDVANKGNAIIDTLAIAIRNKQKNDSMGELIAELDAAWKKLREEVVGGGAAASIDQFTLISSVVSGAWDIVSKKRQAKRQQFANDIQTTCRWKAFQELNPPAQAETPAK